MSIRDKRVCKAAQLVHRLARQRVHSAPQPRSVQPLQPGCQLPTHCSTSALTAARLPAALLPACTAGQVRRRRWAGGQAKPVPTACCAGIESRPACQRRLKPQLVQGNLLGQHQQLSQPCLPTKHQQLACVPASCFDRSRPACTHLQREPLEQHQRLALPLVEEALQRRAARRHAAGGRTQLAACGAEHR